MNPEEVNERIQALLGPPVKAQPVKDCPTCSYLGNSCGRHEWEWLRKHRTPDYANDLNACMAVIRERWPDATVFLQPHHAYIGYSKWYGSYFAVDEDFLRGGPTLAVALLFALEAGNAAVASPEAQGGA